MKRIAAELTVASSGSITVGPFSIAVASLKVQINTGAPAALLPSTGETVVQPN